MAFVISVVSVSPMRADPSHRSEQVSQLLFGEPAEVIEKKEGFTRLKGVYDQYEGWCQDSQLIEIGEDLLKDSNIWFFKEWTTRITVNGEAMYLPFGCSADLLKNGQLQIGSYTIACEATLWNVAESRYDEVAIKQLARFFLNTPYLWGGRSVFGVDCSGFSQAVFKFLGIKLWRDAHQQALQGEAIGFLQEVKCGDLAYFDNDEGRITHVGILLNPETIIHSSGKVRIDRIDNVGIVNSDTGQRTHRLRIIKRVAKL